MKKSKTKHLVPMTALTASLSGMVSQKTKHVLWWLQDVREALNKMITDDDSYFTVVMDYFRYIGATIVRKARTAVGTTFQITICTYRKQCRTAERTRKVTIMIPMPA